VEIPDDQLPARFREQKAEIEKVLPVTVGVSSDGLGRPACLYETGVVLIHEEDMPNIAPELGARRAGTTNSTGYVRFLTDDVPGTVARGRDLTRGVWHNHIVSICRVTSCPADEPYPVFPGDPLPRNNYGDAGRGVRVRVLDTGLVDLADREVAPWLAEGVYGVPDRPLGEHGRISLYAGHGTFIAGVLKCVAPAVTVIVTDEMSWAGQVTELDLGIALEKVLDEADPPDIICIAAGTESATGEPLAALRSFMKKLRAQDRTLLVAAAGNNGGPQAFYPAAEAGRCSADAPPKVVAVGALRRDARGRACFSNDGEWVSVYAPGERLVNAFLDRGHYHYRHDSTDTCAYRKEFYPHCTCVEPVHRYGEVVAFDGQARWSGTSFATPIVAGLVAAQMSEQGTTAPQAARAVLDAAEWIEDDADGKPLLRALPPGYRAG